MNFCNPNGFSYCNRQPDLRCCNPCSVPQVCYKCTACPVGTMGPAGPQGIPGPTGATGPTGPTGPAGSGNTVNSFVIPYSIAEYAGSLYLSTNAQGDPSNLGFSGYGGSSTTSVNLQANDWQNKTITLNHENNYYYGCAFIMPTTATLKSIHSLVATADETTIQAGVTLRPFVAIAICNNDDLVYTILNDTITYTEPYVGGGTIPRLSVRNGNNLNLNLSIAEGNLVAIIIGMTSEGSSENQNLRLALSGSLYFEQI